MTVWHKSMDPARWNAFSLERQVLMIGSEFARAHNLRRDNVTVEVLQCYERALELLDLSADDPKWRPRLRELLRFRETLCGLYVSPPDPHDEFLALYRVLMSWTGSTSRVEL